MNDMTFAYFCIVIYFMGANIIKIVSGTTFVLDFNASTSILFL
jgi:hypothetical protein